MNDIDYAPHKITVTNGQADKAFAVSAFSYDVYDRELDNGMTLVGFDSKADMVEFTSNI